MQAAFDNTNAWAMENSMTINESKTKAMKIQDGKEVGNIDHYFTSVYILLIFIVHVSIISCRQILITGVYNVSVL
jgi:hypothetical protein